MRETRYDNKPTEIFYHIWIEISGISFNSLFFFLSSFRYFECQYLISESQVLSRHKSVQEYVDSWK